MKRRSPCLAVSLLLVAWSPVAALASTIHVPGDQPSIQAGIDAAQSGDTVLVDAGTYPERIDFHGKAITVTSSQGAQATIIDGQSLGSVVTFVSGEGNSSVLRGFTITGGSGTFDPGLQLTIGGGIRCGNAQIAHCSPTIEENVIVSNVAGYGGGISCYNASSPIIRNNQLALNTGANRGGAILCLFDSTPTIMGNTIANNSARIDGAISCRFGAAAVIVDNTITDNQADDMGGAIGLRRSDAVIERNRIARNKALQKSSLGGAIYCQDSSPAITGNELLENQADSAGALSYDSSSLPPIVGNRFAGNVAITNGGAIMDRGASSFPVLVITGNVFEDNVAGGLGGAVMCLGASHFIGNEFRRNHANNGGAICASSPFYLAPTISNNVFTSNTAVTGGAFYGGGPSLAITGNTVTLNEATERGGGFHIAWGFGVVANNLIFANSAREGGGIFSGENASFDNTVVFVNDTIVGNSASKRGGGIAFSSSRATFLNSIVWSNTAGDTGTEQIGGDGSLVVQYSDVQDGYAGDGNFAADPLFADQASLDLHLLAGSPCRDAGVFSPYLPLVDFEGDPRVPSTIDIGADCFHLHLYLTGDPTPGGNVTLKLIAEPGLAPAILLIGSGVQDPPLPTPFGDFFLEFPIVALPLGTIPGDGLLAVTATIPPTVPVPLPVFQQAFVRDRLTNLSVVLVQ
jgi:hypothetical protein